MSSKQRVRDSVETQKKEIRKRLKTPMVAKGRSTRFVDIHGDPTVGEHGEIEIVVLLASAIVVSSLTGTTARRFPVDIVKWHLYSLALLQGERRRYVIEREKERKRK